MDSVNHPSHYNLYPVESVEMAERIWGKFLSMHAAFITAFHYRQRMGYKDDVQQELAKEKWWLDYGNRLAKELGVNPMPLPDMDKIMTAYEQRE